MIECAESIKEGFSIHSKKGIKHEDDDVRLEHFPDIDVQVVEVLITPVCEQVSCHDHYNNYYFTNDVLQIKIICRKTWEAIGRHPEVDVVKLVSAHTETEALTVNPHNNGRVYFKKFVPNEDELDG